MIGIFAATCVMPGTTSLSISSHLPANECSKIVKPVMLPPGRARLATNPSVTGSVTSVKTIGTVLVTRCNVPIFPAMSTFTARARRATPGFIEPCLPSPADKPPSGPNWIHEIKHDAIV
jgi:ATP-dependent DNA ligase